MKMIECPVFECQPKDRIRLVFKYLDTWRKLFWFQVSKEGSIYLGPPQATTLKVGRKKIEGSETRIEYNEGEEIRDPDVINNPKISFHASGITQGAGISQVRGLNLRDLTSQEMLCLLIFKHPQKLSVLDETAIMKRDVCLQYPVDESRPFYARIFVAPKDKVGLFSSSDSNDCELKCLFLYRDLIDVPELCVQVDFSNGPKGPWPPNSSILFVSQNP